MDKDDLLRAILDNPGDDAARLAYADWWEAHGDRDRAEFIRVQCEMATPAEAGLRAAALRRRERELLASHAGAWLAELPNLAGIDWGFLTDEDELMWPPFVRGFVERATAADWTACAAQWPAAVRATPLRGLHFRRLEAEDVPAFARWPTLAGLTHLDLMFSGVGAAGARALAASPYVAALHTLDLGLNGVGDEGLRELAGSAHLATLNCLNLCANDLTAAGAAALADAPLLGRLRTLDLAGNRLGSAGVRLLAGTPAVANLKALVLHGNGVEDDGADALASARHLGGLTYLDVTANRFGPAARAALEKRFGVAGVTLRL